MWMGIASSNAPIVLRHRISDLSADEPAVRPYSLISGLDGFLEPKPSVTYRTTTLKTWPRRIVGGRLTDSRPAKSVPDAVGTGM